VASAGPVALVVSRLHLALGDLAEAESAIDQVTGTSPVWAPHVRLQQARILATAARQRSRGSADPDLALRVTKAALAGATDHALTGVARQAQALLHELAGPGGTGLTRREREVAELAMRGMSAKEIAGRLVLGERTVETHLANIYRKLDVRSRVELMARFTDGLPAGRESA
jgi:DNA-binding NarL/FixJ family response regulator